MNKFEERMAEEKQRIDSITAPEELEARLRKALALDTTTSKKPKRKVSIWKLASIALLFMIIISTNYNGFAFYGKKLLGFDNLISGTLEELNDEGKGQMIEKKKMLEDGTKLIINGIMTDANQMIMYYTLTNPDGFTDEGFDVVSPLKITGFLTNSSMKGGTSVLNEAGTEIKGSMNFEPVSPFSKKLTVHIMEKSKTGQLIEDSISFSYNPNKAMQTEIKQSIIETVKVDKGKITFHSITATPTLTVIDGSLDVENFDRVANSLAGIELIANGKPVDMIGSGSKSSLEGKKFHIDFDALPEQVDSLELIMKEFVGYQKLAQTISLTTVNNELKLDDHELWVTGVSTTSQGVEVRIATDVDVMLDGVSIQTGDEMIPIKTTVNQMKKEQDGRMLKERTMLFDTKLKPESLHIEGIHYMKPYNVTLTDITPKLVELAEKRAHELELTAHFNGFHVSDAREINHLKNEQFNASLMLGPMYHLQEENDRIKAIRELNRVTKKDGIVFVAMMSRFRHILTSLQFPDQWKPNDQIDQILCFSETGSFNHKDEGRFTGAYYFNIEDIKPFMETHGFESLELIGSNVGAVLSEESWNYWKNKGEQEIEKVVKLLIDKATDPYTLGISSHLLYVGRKIRSL